MRPATCLGQNNYKLNAAATKSRNEDGLYDDLSKKRIADWNIKTLSSKYHEIIPKMNEHNIDTVRNGKTKDKGITGLNNYILISQELLKIIGHHE